MRIAGERLPRKNFIQTDRYVIVIQTEMVAPPDDPDRPVYDTETLEFIHEIRQRAERGDVAWLLQQGKVYVALDATTPAHCADR
jgi:hypothetical protein